MLAVSVNGTASSIYIVLFFYYIYKLMRETNH